MARSYAILTVKKTHRNIANEVASNRKLELQKVVVHGKTTRPLIEIRPTLQAM